MPPGCHRLVYATVSHRLTQLMPFNPDDAVRADGETVRGEYYYEISESEPELILRAWSPLTAYPHTITFDVNMLPAEVAAPWQIIRDFVDIVKKLMGI